MARDHDIVSRVLTGNRVRTYDMIYDVTRTEIFGQNNLWITLHCLYSEHNYAAI